MKQPYRFAPVKKAMQSWIDREILPGVSYAILIDGDIVESACLGYASIENRKAMMPKTIFRLFSNSKIITSVAALCCLEDGCFSLDEPLEKYIPAFSTLRVLRKDHSSLEDTEALQRKPTVRQLMSHNAGFSYGILSESPVDKLYSARRLLDPQSSLTEMVAALAEIPLAYQPGTRFLYSISTDVLARLVEVWSGESFGEFIRRRILNPLSMSDTGFYVPDTEQHRMAAHYVAQTPKTPDAPGLDIMSDAMMGGYGTPKPLESGGGGLVSTLEDYTRFLKMLIGRGETGGVRILQPETVAIMTSNQLPAGVSYHSKSWPMPHTGFGLGVAVKAAPHDGEPAQAAGEYHWGGISGTHTWVSPGANIACLLFTQKYMSFCQPFAYEFKRLVYRAICGES